MWNADYESKTLFKMLNDFAQMIKQGVNWSFFQYVTDRESIQVNYMCGYHFLLNCNDFIMAVSAESTWMEL